MGRAGEVSVDAGVPEDSQEVVQHWNPPSLLGNESSSVMDVQVINCCILRNTHVKIADMELRSMSWADAEVLLSESCVRTVVLLIFLQSNVVDMKKALKLKMEQIAGPPGGRVQFDDGRVSYQLLHSKKHPCEDGELFDNFHYIIGGLPMDRHMKREN